MLSWFTDITICHRSVWRTAAAVSVALRPYQAFQLWLRTFDHPVYFKMPCCTFGRRLKPVRSKMSLIGFSFQVKRSHVFRLKRVQLEADVS